MMTEHAGALTCSHYSSSHEQVRTSARGSIAASCGTKQIAEVTSKTVHKLRSVPIHEERCAFSAELFPSRQLRPIGIGTTCELTPIILQAHGSRASRIDRQIVEHKWKLGA